MNFLSKPVISIRALITSDQYEVSQMVAVLESQDTGLGLWTACFPSSAKGGKNPCGGALWAMPPNAATTKDKL